MANIAEAVARAADLARDVAPDLDCVLLTHFADADTLDTLRPSEMDLETAIAVNRAVASEMLHAGVEILVQRADRAAFRRWISGREDTPENRRAWIDRGRLLRGAEALALLGLKDGNAPAPQTFGKAPGPVADRLLEAYGDEDSEAFDVLARGLLDAGRIDVLDLAVRKLGERDGDEAGDELNWVLLVAAEGAAIGPSGWAELVALPVALPAGALPDEDALCRGLAESGALDEREEVRLLPGWRSPGALEGLSFAAVRRVLLDLVDGKAPRDLPPGDTDDLARRGFGVLIGLRIGWDIAIWDAIAAGSAPAEEEDSEDEARREALFDRWRGMVFQSSEGAVPLNLVAFSEAAEEIAGFLAEAGAQTGGLEDIRDFVAHGRREAGGEAVVCHPEVIGGDLHLTLSTQGGRVLDSLTLPASSLPVRADEMPELIGAFVALV